MHTFFLSNQFCWFQYTAGVSRFVSRSSKRIRGKLIFFFFHLFGLARGVFMIESSNSWYFWKSKKTSFGWCYRCLCTVLDDNCTRVNENVNSARYTMQTISEAFRGMYLCINRVYLRTMNIDVISFPYVMGSRYMESKNTAPRSILSSSPSVNSQVWSFLFDRLFIKRG